MNTITVGCGTFECVLYSKLTVGSDTCWVAFCGIFVLFFRWILVAERSVVRMRVFQKEKMILETKMVTTMEDFIYGFESIWLYAGNDERNG